MILTSWNVNSLRSTEKEFIKFIADYSPDVVMIQELRAHPDQLSFFLTNIAGYSSFFNDSGRPGYAGTALYYKSDSGVTDVTNKTGNDVLDSEGRTIVCQCNDTTIINFYTPNGNSSEERLVFKLQFYDEVGKYISKLLKEQTNIIIGGDLNVAATEKDLFDPVRSARFSAFLPQEREWFQSLLDVGFTDSFRMFEKEGGHYTWWHMKDPKRKKNKGWRFDYFLVSDALKPKVRRAEILKDVYGSDHCPILLEMD